MQYLIERCMCDKCHMESQYTHFLHFSSFAVVVISEFMLLSIMFQSYNESQLFCDIVPGQDSLPVLSV